MNKVKLATIIAATALAGNSYAEFMLEEVIVTAQKREQSLQDVPLSVAVISSDALRRQNINDIASLAQAAPSLNFQEGFGPTSTNFNIRGIASYSFEGGIQPSVSLVVDGVASARNGEFVAELSDIERVEVLRGPQGTLFGRNSTAGAINIVTQRPGEEFAGSAEVTVTDDDEQYYRLKVDGPLSDTVSASLVAFHKDREGHIENIYPGADDLGGSETKGARAKLDVDFNDDLNVLFTAEYTDTTHGMSPQLVIVPDDFGSEAGGTFLRLALQGGGDPVLGQAVIDDPLKVNVNDPLASKSTTESYAFSADVTWNLSETLTLRSISGYRNWEAGITVDVDSGAGQVSNRADFGFLPVHVETNVNSNPSSHNVEAKYSYFSQEVRLEGNTEAVDWTAGFYYQDFTEDQGTDIELYIPFGLYGSSNANNYGLFAQRSQNSNELQAYAVFADATFHLSDTLDVFGGFRWSEEDLEIEYNNTILMSPDNVDEIGPTGANTFNDATNTVTVDQTNPFVAVIPQALGTVDDSSGDWSARLGIAWQATDSVNLYASASRGFVGTGAIMGRDGSPTSAFLDATTAESFEFGIKSQLGDRVQLNAAMYTMQVSDLQTSALVPGTILTATINAGDLDINGFETDLIWAATDNMRFTVGLAYTDATVEDLLQGCYSGQTLTEGCIDGQADMDGSNAPNTPELKYNIAMDIDMPLGNMPFDAYASVTYIWQDDVIFTLNQDPLTVQDDYGLLDIAFGFIDKEGRYELSIFGKNVTDEFFVNDYSESVGTIGRAYARATRGAQAYYGAKFTYKF